MNRLLFILFLLLMPGFLAAQQATEKPRRGEGISTFLERNGRPGRAYYNEFLELNKKRLKGKKELDATDKAFLETYGQKVDFTDFSTLSPIVRAMGADEVNIWSR